MYGLFASLFSALSVATIAPVTQDSPAREPQIAVHGSTVALAFGAGHAIYFTHSADSGGTFGTPVKVAESAILPLSRHRGPRIAFAGSTIVITAVTGRTLAEGPHAHGLPSDGDLMSWRSADGGKTWSKGQRVNDVPGAATEGLHSLAANEKGDLFAVWLDKRQRGTRLFGSRSADGGLTWTKNVLVYESPEGTICECCHPTVAFDRDGSVLVMWRNWLNGSRDMYLARSTDGQRFSAPGKLGEGTWKLNACPMDGGGLTVSRQGVVTAWRRERTIYLNQPGQPETAVADGSDVAISAGAQGVYMIWSSPAGLWAVSPENKQPHSLGVTGSFPSIAALSGGSALAAWEQDGRIAIQQLK